eukprot:scaffold98197_cov18-Tisochrysis_lutea.AAC.1
MSAQCSTFVKRQCLGCDGRQSWALSDCYTQQSWALGACYAQQSWAMSACYTQRLLKRFCSPSRSWPGVVNRTIICLAFHNLTAEKAERAAWVAEACARTLQGMNPFVEVAAEDCCCSSSRNDGGGGGGG